MALPELLAEIERQGGEGAVVGLDLFFDGNEDEASLGCNLSDHPGIRTFAEVLRALRNRPDVDDVLVRISEVLPDGEWPFSDAVYVLTKAPASDVATWAAVLEPDDDPWEEEWGGRRAVVLWWD